MSEIAELKEDLKDSEEECEMYRQGLLNVQEALDMRCITVHSRVTCIDLMGTEHLVAKKLFDRCAELEAERDDYAGRANAYEEGVEIVSELRVERDKLRTKNSELRDVLGHVYEYAKSRLTYTLSEQARALLAKHNKE